MLLDVCAKVNEASVYSWATTSCEQPLTIYTSWQFKNIPGFWGYFAQLTFVFFIIALGYAQLRVDIADKEMWNCCKTSLIAMLLVYCSET